ncbi:metal ABC transporter solute-binding protein, Zn/Mn family [Naasia sp. SYSU D00057]|uniref:metal ABC transporter solute-binding protein, Zn/Mn family n=1 Tax=Naasia sp. SYSU D00057 TaxID=2817380 RepID=UPI001B30F954|nr:zinc ABC transporter substrate-binding protein [Naasia sp. SYSU D00057]
MKRPVLPALTLAAVPALLLAGCAGASSDAATDGTINVVASTDVWGDIAAAVGGDRIVVTSIIDSPDKDPHEYEATGRDQLAVSRADLLVENGGGYDPFLDTLIAAAETEAPVVSAVDLSGLAGEHTEEHAEEHGEESGEDDHGHIEGVNEHVWYDLHAAEAVAESVAEELTRLDPAGEDAYASGLAEFQEGVAALESRVEELHATLEGRRVLVTEPVPVHLLTELGMTDATPAEFSEAVEEDSDVPPKTLQEVLDLVAAGDVALLGYNTQASTTQTETVRSAAEDAGIPVVDFAETLPEGMDYVEWMTANVDAVAAALAE